MPNSANKQGYTIVEVMIFLAISGLMFALAASFISGKQARAEFKQGVNDLNVQIQQTINDVSNGYYPHTSDFNCVGTTSGVSVSAGTNGQGGNKGCVFMGKVLQFHTSPEDPKVYNVFTVAGLQFNPVGTTNSPVNFVAAKPVIVSNLVGVDLTENKNIQWGVEVTGVYRGSANAANAVGAFGVFGDFGKYAGVSLVSSAKTAFGVVVPGSQTTNSSGAAVSNFNSSGTAAALDSTARNQSFIICLKGSNNQHGSITIGSNNGQRLTNTMKIGSTPADVGCI